MYKCIVIIIILSCIIFLYYASVTENFMASDCQTLNKDGLICSIPDSSLFSNKCYKVKQSPLNPAGTYEHINVSHCRYYPSCPDIGQKCEAKTIKKLADGYVELI